MGQIQEHILDSIYQHEPKFIVSGSQIDGTSDLKKLSDPTDIDFMAVFDYFTREEQTKYFMYPAWAPGHVIINVSEAPEDSWLRDPEITVQISGVDYLCPTKFNRTDIILSKQYIQAMGTAIPNLEISRDEKRTAIAIELRPIGGRISQESRFLQIQSKTGKTDSNRSQNNGAQSSVDIKALYDMLRSEEDSMEFKDDGKEPFTETFPDILPQAVLTKIDKVIVFECEGWPAVAKHWPKRKRNWPTKQIIDHVINGGYHLVPKASPRGNPYVEWRFSFSVAENYIMGKISNIQFTVFSICKELLKKCFDVGEIVSTYHLKTVFLWSLEQKHLKIWKTRYLKQCVFGVLEHLLHSLGSGSLPHYFMSTVNLLSYMPPEFLSTAGSKITSFFQTLTVEQIPVPMNEAGWGNTTIQFAVLELARFKRLSDLLKAYITCESNSFPDYERDIQFVYSVLATNAAEDLCNIALLTTHATQQGILTADQLKLMEKLLNFGHLACKYILKNMLLGISHNNVSNDADRIIKGTLYMVSAWHALVNVTNIVYQIVNYMETLIKSKFEYSSWGIIEQGLQTLASKLDLNMDDFTKDKPASQLANEHFINTYISWKPKEWVSEPENQDEEKDWEHHLEEAVRTVFGNEEPLLLLNVLKCRNYKSVYIQGHRLKRTNLEYLLLR